MSVPGDASGVLPDSHLRRAVAGGLVDAGRFTIPDHNVQPASLDLRLGEFAHRVRCSFLPGEDTVEEKLKQYSFDVLDLRDAGAVLDIGRPYLIQLKERLALPKHLRGRANPKSSTGRIDVFTRVITDHGHRFDEIAPGYAGPLWLEVVPLSFAVRVREDVSLNQLRLVAGRPEMSDDEVRAFHERTPLLFRDGEPVPSGQLAFANGLFLGLDLRGDSRRRVGYRAREGAPLLDLTLGKAVDGELYWEPVRSEVGNRLALIPRKFYLLMSDEAVSVPPGVSAEMTAYDPTSGELRTHYAGFFDPGFGFDRSGGLLGSRAALEVRAHDVEFMIEDHQRVCKLTFQRMLDEPEHLYGSGIGSNYQQQDETLSKYFVRSSPWP
jgi:dCTP deaminase